MVCAPNSEADAATKLHGGAITLMTTNKGRMPYWLGHHRTITSPSPLHRTAMAWSSCYSHAAIILLSLCHHTVFVLTSRYLHTAITRSRQSRYTIATLESSCHHTPITLSLHCCACSPLGQTAPGRRSAGALCRKLPPQRVLLT